MKVLVLHSELGVLRGGGENFTRNLFAAFGKAGHDIAAAFVANGNGQYPIPLPPNIRPIPLSGWWSRKFGQEMLSSFGHHLSFHRRLREEWDRAQAAICWRTVRWHDQRFTQRVEREFCGRWKDFDVVYVHGSVVLASEVARHRPTVLRLPGPVTVELAPELRAVQAVCANGDCLSRIREFLGDHALELSPGLDCQTFHPGSTSVRTRLGWTDRHWVVGYVGRLAHVKGVDLLAAAFREIARTEPSARLLLIGRGEEEGAIRSILAAEFDRGMVHLEPDVSHRHLPEWYRAMDLFVMPSRYENFSNALLEALACGIPCVASDVGGNRHLTDTGGGWLFANLSGESLSTRLCTIMERPQEGKDRGALGAQYVRRHHSWDSGAERLEQIIMSRLGVRG